MQLMRKRGLRYYGRCLGAAVVIGAPAVFLAVNPIWLTLPEQYGMPLLALLHVVCTMVVLAAPLLFWYNGGTGVRHMCVDLSVAAFFFAGLLFIAAQVLPSLAGMYWSLGRLSIAVGIGAAMVIRSSATYFSVKLLQWTGLAAAGLVFLMTGIPTAFSAPFTIAGQTLSIQVLIDGAAAFCYLTEAFLSRRLHVRRRFAFWLQIGLVLAAVSSVTYALFKGGSGAALLVASAYESMAYLIVAVIFTGLLTDRPSMRIEKLNETVKLCQARYEKTSREAAENRMMMRDAMQKVSTEKSHRLMREMFEQIQKMTLGRMGYQELLEQIVAIAAKSLNTNHVFLTLREGVPPTLQTVAYRSAVPLDQMDWKTVFTRKVFSEAKTLFVEDFNRMGPATSEENAYGGFRSMVGVPILFQDRPVGVLEILSRQGKSFSSQDAGSLATFAEFAATVIYNAKGYAGSKTATMELELLVQCLQAVNDGTSSFVILHSIANLLARALKAQTVVAVLLRSQAEAIQAQEVFHYGFSDVERKNILRVLEGLQADRLEDYKHKTPPLLLNAVVSAAARPTGRSPAVLPFYSRGVLQGIIVYILPQSVDSGQNVYSHDNLQLIANQTAVAIERSYLFESVREVGYTDALTGLANRRFFDFILSREIGRARRYDRSISLMMLDIDHFKQINDTYGHPAGDLILKTMGDLLRNLFRKTDLAARYGGEEFSIILPETELDIVVQMAERFRDAVSRTRFATDNGFVSLTVSIGVAALPEKGDAMSLPETDLLQAADQALYKAKKMGRNRVETA